MPRHTPTSIHICSFDETMDLRGKGLTYDALKTRVLEAGRFSAFEADASKRRGALFDRLRRDPELETTPDGFPWIRVRRREAT